MKRCILVFLIGVYQVMFSQAPYVVIQNFTTADGLPTNSIRCVKSDKTGNIWFGSSAGLTKFDGNTFVTYTTADGLPSNTINRISLASNGDLLIATANGISRFDGTTFTNYLSGIICRHVIESSTNELWVATSGSGVRRFNGSTWITYTTANGLPHNFVNILVEDLNHNIWAGTSDGVARFDISSWTAYDSLNGTNKDADQVISAACDKNGHIWFGSKPGFGVGGGVTRFDGSQWIHYNIAEGLAGRQVEDIVVDAANGKFFATFNNGASFFEDIAYPMQYVFKTIGQSGGLISNQLYGIDIDEHGFIWIASNNGVSKVAPIRYLSTTVNDAVCNTGMTGSIQINVSALHHKIYISVDNGLTFTLGTTASGLAPNTYHVAVTDSSYVYSVGNVTVSAVPPISPGLPDTLQLCQGDSIQLVPSQSGSNPIWSPDTYISSTTAMNPLVYPPASQYYYLEMLDQNGCQVSDSVWIKVLPKTPMEVQINGNIITIIGDFISYVWYYYDQLIPGAFTNVYAATQPGIYYCYATDANGCTTSSGMIHYNNPMINEYEQPYNFSFLYEHSTLQLFIHLPEFSSSSINLRLFTLNGQMIYSGKLLQLTDGLYTGSIPLHLTTAQYLIQIGDQIWIPIFVSK